MRHLSCSAPGQDSLARASVSQHSFWSHSIVSRVADGKEGDEKKNEKQDMEGP